MAPLANWRFQIIEMHWLLSLWFSPHFQLFYLVDRPIEDMLSAVAICVWHTASISAAVASIFIANSFLIRSVSLRVHSIQDWMCLCCSASVEKLHPSTSPQIHLTNLSGVLTTLILISSSWYILHHWKTGWSIELCRNSIKSLAFFLFLSHSFAVAPEGFYYSCLMGPKKLSRYSSHVVSTYLSGIPLECVPALYAFDVKSKVFVLFWWVPVKRF